MQSEGCFCSPETQSGVNFPSRAFGEALWGTQTPTMNLVSKAVGNLKLQPTAPANLPGDDYACVILDVWTSQPGRPQLQPPSDCSAVSSHAEPSSQACPQMGIPPQSHRTRGMLCLRASVSARLVCREHKPKRTL